MNAIEAVNHYAQNGECVDSVLQHIVTSEVKQLHDMLKGNDGMSVMEIRAQFAHENRMRIAAHQENEKLREALTRILDLNYFNLARFEAEVIEIAAQALAGESNE